MSATKKNSAWPPFLFYTSCLLLLFLAAVASGRMLFDWAPLTAFYPFFYGLQLGLVLALLGLLQCAYGMIRKQGLHGRYGAYTLGPGLLPLAVAVIVVGPAGFRAPMIHDITTDMTDPPQFSIISSLRRADENSLEYAGKEVAELQRQAFPSIKPLYSTEKPALVHAHAREAVESLAWTIVVDDEQAGTIEAYEKSTIFGFIDDVVIRIAGHPRGTRLDIRSVSRVGKGDLGANAARIERFFSAYRKAAGET